VTSPGKGPDMTDREKIAAILAPEAMAKRSAQQADFAREIAAKFQRALDRGAVLSVRQSGLLDRIMGEVERGPAPQLGAGFDALLGLFAKAAASGLRRPGLRVQVQGIELGIAPAPATGRNAGSIYVRADGEYAGKVTAGEWLAAHGVPPAVTEAVVAFAADPVRMAAESGRATGACAFCRLALSDPRSVEVGYGEQCATRWSLPWGEPKAATSGAMTAGQKAAATRRLRQAAKAG
jgi:hypothetical protein